MYEVISEKEQRQDEICKRRKMPLYEDEERIDVFNENWYNKHIF